MRVINRSALTNKINMMHIQGLTPSRYEEILVDLTSTTLPIRDMCPDLSSDEREFLLTGITPEEWEAVFGRIDDMMEHKLQYRFKED